MGPHLTISARRCSVSISGVPAGQFSNLAEKISGRLLSELNFCGIEEIYEQGLHQAMRRPAAGRVLTEAGGQ